MNIDQMRLGWPGPGLPATASAADTPLLGLCGCGNWGRNLARTFARLGALAAVCDTDAAAAEARAQAHGVPPLDFPVLLAMQEVDAVAVATPAATHYALARAALLAGKHVFVEKPLALELGHARELVRLAEASGRILMVGHICLYHAAFQALEGMVALGAIGRVTRIHATRLKPPGGRPAEGALFNLATHDLAMVLTLMDAAPRRVVPAIAFDAAGPCEDVSAIRLEFDGGRSADILVSQDHRRAERRFTVLGEAGALVFDDLAGWDRKLVLVTNAQTTACPLDPEDVLERECADFLACILTGGRPRSAGAAALPVVETLERAHNAGRAGGSSGCAIPLALEGS